MQRIVEFTDGKDFYAVPENDVKNFLAEDPKSTRVRRFVGKDGSSYAVPDYDVKAFLAEDSDVEEVFPVQTTDGKSYLVPQSASKGRITKFNSKAFANDEAMGGAKLGALEAQAEGGVGAYEDDGSIGNWFKNLWNTFSHAAGGKMVSGDMQAKTHQLVNNAYKGADGKDHSFEDLPDEVLDQYMNTIAPNGYWSYLGNAIGLGGKNNFMAEWDKNVGSKIEDPIERKKARVAYAREFAQISFENTEREKDRARAEIEGREKAFGAGAVAGTTQIAGYALPMMAPGGVGVVLSAGVEGTTRRNQLLQDGYEVTDSGEIIRTSKGDTRNQALVKGAVGGATTALIEKYGGKLAGKALGKVAGKIPGADKIAGSSVGKFLSKTGKFIDRYFGWTGQQNAPEEYAEEFLQGLTDAAFGLAERESEKEGTTALGRMSKFTGEFFTAKNLYDLGEAMFLMQLVGGTVGHLRNRSDGKKADKILDSLGYDVSSAKDFTADEKWRAIDAHYRGMSKYEVNEMLEKGAKAMDGLLKQFESESLATVDGRDRMAALHSEAVKKIIEARKEGKDVSRKMIRDAGLSEDVWKDVAARNDLGDSFIADRKRAADLKRSKMDAYQASALADTISEFFGDSPEAAKVFDRIVADLKDASILDDPAVRENLVMEQGEKIWAEGREGRIKAARERAKAAQKKGIPISDNVVNGNTEVKNETRTDETQQKPVEAQPVVSPAAEAARPVEAAETSGKADGAVEPKSVEGEVPLDQGAVAEPPKTAPTSAPTEAKANTPTKSAEAVEDGSRGAETNPTKNDTSVARQTHDEAVEDVVAKAKSDGRKLDELGELRPPTPKIGSKPGRVSPLKKMDEKSVVNALKNVASVDDVRGHLHRVHVENGEIVATDGRILLFGKAPKGMKDGEYATTPIGQKRIDDRYPLWKQVVPDAKRNGYKEVGVISNGDISTDSVAFAGRLNKRFHKEQRKDSPRADIRIGEQLVSPELLKNLTDAMFRLGVKDITVYQGKTINSPLLLKGRNADGEITGVIMPLRLGEDVDFAKKTHVRLFGKSTEESADKKTAHNSKNETKSAETAKQTPKNETKKSFEEKYREWAEEDAPAWAKDLSPEEKAEYERLLDELLRPKDGKSDIERAKKEAEDYRALMEFEKAHTPKRGRGRPKKEDVDAKADTPNALADNYAKFVQQRIDRFNSAKTSADFDKVKDFADGELEAREKVKSNPEAIKKFNEKYGKLFAEQNRVIHEATEKGRQAQEAETAKAEEDAKAFRASPEGFKQLEKDVNRTFGRYRLNVNSVHKPEEVISVSDLIKRGYKVEKAKRGAAYNYRLTPPDGNGWFKIGKKELRLDGEAYNKAIADLIEYSERVAKGEKVVEASTEPTTAKVETAEAKPTKPDMKPVREAMRKLGTLGMADIPTLEKALKQAEGHGQTDRADMIKTLLDYKKNLPKYDDAKSDKSVGGRYRASIESDKPLDDPKFKAWAKRRGVVPSQSKREEYDAAMMKSATKKLSRWIKGVKIKEVNAISEAGLNGETRAAIKQEEYDAWNKILDDYENKSFDSTKNYPVLSRMPAVLRRIGVNDLPITMRGGILQKITGEIETSKGEYHGIPVSELRKLQIELDNPIAVFDSASRDDSIVVLTRLVDNQNNERAVVALRLDQAGSGSVRINAITSAYGKDKGSFEGWIKDKKLLRYVNKEARNKSARWLQLPGDSKFRALNILTEKDFSSEELGRIIPKEASEAQERDTAYLDAVKRKDIKTAQRMVREAAAKAMPNTKVVGEDGLPLVVYHGTHKYGFSVFKVQHDDDGVYTTSSKENADSYSVGAQRGIYDLFVNLKNPLEVDAEGSEWSGMKFKGIEKFKKALNTRVISPADLVAYARKYDYDGVVIRNVLDGGAMGDDIIAFNSSQIKSADPATYDDAGNIIPLSKRFDAENDDIRYLRDGKRIVGSYNTKTGEVTLAKGASVETVAHELGWHASFDWAKKSAKTNKKAKALYERMLRFAEDAPPEIKAEVAALYGKLDADAFADEVGAMLFARDTSANFESEIDADINAPWYKKAWNTLVDIVKNFLSAHGMNRVDLDGVENMSEARFKDFLATAMLSGKTLGERTGFSMDLDMSKKAKWERNLSDRFAPIRDLIERVDGADGEAYRMARTLEGMAQMGHNRAERTMKRVDKILGKDISPEFLAQYMQAKAYEERNAKIEKRNQRQDGSGMTAKDAEAILAQADKRGIVDKCEEAADILWKMQDEGLQRRVDAGLISQKTADEWRKAEPHHVPWRDAIDPDSGEWMGRNFAGKEFETAEGRSTFASGDPITLMLQEYENAYSRAAENALRQHLSDIARLNGDVGTIYDRITVDAKGKRSFIKYSKGEQAKLLSIPDGAKIESTKKDDGGMVNVLTFRENGDTKYLVLNGSLGEAVAAAVTGRSLARPNAKLAGFMRGYAATATALSPTFAIRNTMADHFDIHGNMVKDFGLWKGEKLFAKMVAEEGKMSKDLLKYVHTGAFEVDANGKATTAFGKLIEEYEAAGGAIGGMRTEGYDVIQKRIQADFRAGRNRLRSIGKEIFAGWTDLQKMSELFTRLATFKVMKESGMSAKDAAMWSRESTVDFNKKGNLTNMTNILWMFSNSALGSGVRQAKGLLTTKNGLKLAGGLAAWGFVEGMLECVMNEEDDDEAEKKGLGTGADINEYTRQNSAYIRFGDKIYRTNLHMGPYGYLKYFGNVAARVMCGRMDVAKAAKELGLTAVEVGAAFTGVGNVSADALVETGVPTALQPFVQMATGKDYAGRPMYKTKYNEAKPDSSHGRTSTAEGYKKIAEGINWLSGGDKYSKGGIDIAPETVKLLAETAGKNLAKDIVNFAQLGSMAMSGDWDVRNMPFARDMVRKVDGNENRYYEALAKFNEDKYAYSNPNLTREEKRRYLREHPWLRTNGTIGGTVVGTLKKKIDEWRRLEEREDVSEENKAKYKEFRRKAQARVIELMTPGK